MTDRETMKLALDALEQMKAKANFECWNLDICDEAIAALKERLAQPADPTGQAPCARHCEATAFQIVIKNLRGEIECLKAPQRTWVGLTDEEIWTILQFRGYNLNTIDIAKTVEAKLKEKNNG